MDLFVLLIYGLAVTMAQKCDDIDTSACQLMANSRPDLCSDPTISKTACPRFCKLCPVECYHCNATVLDYHMCNNTKLCNKGEVCMKKELKSFNDGHHEYQMTCELKALCDGGTDLTFAFGKRHLGSRDISVTCCADDLCNYPQQITTITTTAKSHVCYKDIVFLVDQSSNLERMDHIAIVETVEEVVQRLEIGTDKNLVAYYGYDQVVHSHIELQDHQDKQSLLLDLERQKHHHPHASRYSDTPDAINFLVHHILTTREGDRSNFPDAVVLIGDQTTAQNFHLTFSQREELIQASKDVIVLSNGYTSASGFAPSGSIDVLATDQNHIIHVHDLTKDRKSVV